MPTKPRDTTPIADEKRGRYGIYRLCVCADCAGSGKIIGAYEGHVRGPERCPSCRGEGKTLQEIGDCDSQEAAGEWLGRLAFEHEFLECPPALLDRQGKVGEKWLIPPFPQTARTVTAAARLLSSQRDIRKDEK